MSATLATSIPRRRLLLIIFSMFMLLAAVSLSRATSAFATPPAWAADTLTVASTSASTTAGDQIAVTVTANNTDTLGTDTAYTGTVALSSTPSGDTWAATGTDINTVSSGDYTFAAGDDGVAHFLVTVKGTAVAQTLTATDTTTGTVTGTSPSVTVYQPTLGVATTADTTDVLTGGTVTETVTALNYDGLTTDTGYTGKVALTSNATGGTDAWVKAGTDTNAVSSGDYTFAAADNGTATFTVTVNAAVDTIDTLTATDTTTAAITGFDGLSVVGPVTQYGVVDSSSNTANDGNTVVVTATAEDVGNHAVTSYTGSVTLTSVGATDVTDTDAIAPTGAVTLIDGAAIFQVTVNGVGVRTFTATDHTTGTIKGTDSFTDTVGPAAMFVVTDSTSGHELDGATTTVTATAEDQAGNKVTGYSGTPTLASSVLTDTGLSSTATNSGGVVTWTVTVVGIGSHTFTATDSVHLISGSETNTDLAGPVSKFAVADNSLKTAVDGSAITVTATAEDSAGSKIASYGGSVKLTSTGTSDSDVIDASPSTLTNPATALSGVATFSVTVVGLGSHVFTAKAGSVTGTETFTDAPGAVTQFAVTDSTAHATAVDGSTVTVTATAEDAAGSVITTYGSAADVMLTSSVSTDVVPTTAATATSGVATFSVTVKGTGSRTFTATDQTTASITGTESFSDTIGPVTKFAVADNKGGIAADGTVVTVTATAEDAQGSTVSAYTGAVKLTSSVLTDVVAPATTDTAVAGVATFTVTLTGTPGTARSFTAADASTISITGIETGFVDVAKTGSTLQFTVAITTAAPTGGYENGEPVVAKVTAVDSTGATVTGYTGTIKLTSVDGDGIAYPGSGTPTSYTYLATDKGVKTYKLTLLGCTSPSTGSCSDKITATDQATNAITGNTGTVTVVPGAVKKLVVTAPGSYVKATGIVEGTSTAYTVTPENTYSQPVLTFVDKIHVGSSDAWADLPLPNAQVYGATGTTTKAAETFSVTLNSVGSETITVKDLAASTTVAPGSISIKSIAGAADHLDIIADDNAENGSALDVTVTAVDAEGHPVLTGYTTPKVTLSSAGGDMIPTVDNGVALTKGVHKFVVTLGGCNAGTCADTFTAKDDGTTTGGHPTQIAQKTSYIVHVTEGAVTQLGIMAGGNTPANAKVTPHVVAVNGTAVHGDPLLPATTTPFAGGVKVTAENVYGQTVEDFTGTVHFSSSDPLADLPASYTFTGGPDTNNTATIGGCLGTTTGVGCDNGVATFNASSETTGNGQVIFNTIGLNKTLTVTDVRNNGIKGTVKVNVT